MSTTAEPPSHTPHAEGDEAEPYRRWGHLASLGIMLLALFAFGLEVKESKLEVHWTEVPAILIVFVLAELGVELVARAHAIGESASRTRDDADQINQRSRQLIATSTRLGRSTRDTLGATSLQVTKASKDVGEQISVLTATVTRLDNHTAGLTLGAHLIDAGSALMSHTGIVDASFWTSLESFVRSWTPSDGGADPESKRVVGYLCKSFLGEGTESGTVRRSSDAVSCVTVDSVYVDVSRRWLEAIEESSNKNYVVRAITTLTPTEFALPSLWWPDGSTSIRGATRVKTLIDFVAQVIGHCSTGRGIVEYERLTVFAAPGVELNRLPNARVLVSGDCETKGAGVGLSTVAPEHRRVGDMNLQTSLRDWFIWDRRVLDENHPCKGIQPTTMAGWLGEVCRATGRTAREPQHHLSWGPVAAAAGLTADQIDDLPPRPASHQLPPLDASKVAFFVPDPYSNPMPFALAYLPEPLRRETLRTRARQLAPGAYMAALWSAETESLTAQGVLERAGWLSLGVWYERAMHRSSRAGGGARWLLVEKPDDAMLRPFRLEWDQSSWPTLELLLVGQKLETGEYRWLGAALSDLDLDSPACVVKLVTGKVALDELSSAYDAMWLASETARKGGGGSWSDSFA